MRIYARAKMYWLDYRDPAGNRVRFACSESEEEARDRLGEIRTAIRFNAYDPEKFVPKLIKAKFKAEAPKPKPAATGYEFSRACELYLENRYAAGKLPSSYRALAKYWPEAFKGRVLESITAQEVEQVLHRWRKDRGWSEATRNNALRQLGGLFSHALKHDWIARHPLERGRVSMLPEDNARQRWLRPHELDALVNAAQADPDTRWMVPILRFAPLTGMRLGELTGLRLADFQRDAHGRGTLTVRKTKNRKPLNWPLEDEAMEIVEAQAERCRFPADHLFPGPGGGNARSEIRRHLPKVVRAAGLIYGKAHPEGVTFHTFRHSMASLALNGGVSAETVQKLGNWRDRRMVERYAKVSDESMRAGAARLAEIVRFGRRHKGGTTPPEAQDRAEAGRS